MQTATDVVKKLRRIGTPEKAAASARDKKIGKGEYGYGDVFFGVTVPEQRQVAQEYKDLSLKEIVILLKHPVHECRLTALFILVGQFKKGDKEKRRKKGTGTFTQEVPVPLRASIVALYLRNTKRINNWDLVDSSAPQILGTFLLDKPREILYTLAHSKNLWERRIAIIATQAFIRAGGV